VGEQLDLLSCKIRHTRTVEMADQLLPLNLTGAHRSPRIDMQRIFSAMGRGDALDEARLR